MLSDMKRTLLTSALTVMALAASAQVSEVAKAKGDGFYFMPKSHTVTGVITPYSTIGVEPYYNIVDKKSEFTVYDGSFNVEKTFSYDRKEFKYNVTPMKALANFTTKDVLDKGWEGEVRSFDAPIKTMDEFKAAVLNGGDGADVTFFTDHNGNFAFYEGSYNIEYTTSWDSNKQKDVPAVRESYYYYNSSDNKLYRVDRLTMSIEFDTSNLAWEADEYNPSREETYTEQIEDTEVYDFDANCNEDSYGYLSQNVFNNDDKYEFLVYTYRQTSAPENVNTTLDNGLRINGIENGKLVVKKEEQDKYYESYTSVKNEDGKELFTLPNSDKGIYRVNGKTYIESYESQGNGQGQYVIYLLDNTGTGITELARTNAVKSGKTFNMAGMQVSKDAKGIVIQQGGKKYINK